jgi:hypothetical protein
MAPTAAVASTPIPNSVTNAVKGLRHVVALSTLAIIGLSVAILVGLDGWEYYGAPLSERSFLVANRWLRPSAPVGHALGIGGFLMMLVPVIYSIRKKVKRFRDFGRIQTWLEVHIFSGIVGPAMVTFHTSFKFNGIVSVAYWSMVAVVLSGFVGRYLYVRIPKTIRGQELTQAELDQRARELSERLAEAALPAPTLAAIEGFEQRVQPSPRPSYLSLFVGERRMQRELKQLRRGGADRAQLHDAAIQLIAERATLRRRIAYLKKTKVLFDAWHVFHMPLVYVMFVIVAAHVAVTLYMGYVPFAD